MSPSRKDGASDSSPRQTSLRLPQLSQWRPKKLAAELIRGMGLGSAVALNMLDMIGVGPFITLPLVVAAMHGPQAIARVGSGAALAVCDGLVMAELGASMPTRRRLLRISKADLRAQELGPPGVVSFYLATDVQRAALDCFRMHRACGLRGLSVAESAQRFAAAQSASSAIPLLGRLEANCRDHAGNLAGDGQRALLAVVLLYRRITSIGRLSKFLWGGVLLTLAWVISRGRHAFSRRAGV